jgi:uncharacterized protein YjbI with pentapeptide repeats
VTQSVMPELNDPTEPWAPRRWPASPAVTALLRKWLEDTSQTLFAINEDMQGADLSHGTFTECWFSRTDFRGTTLRGTGFWAAHCEQTCFASADLAGADFIRTRLIEADFTRAVLTQAEFGRAEAHRACFKYADLQGAKLGDGSFLQADFTGANLARVDFGTAYLYEAVLTNANLAGATGSFYGPVTVAPGLTLDDEALQRWLTQQGVQVTVRRKQKI